MENKENKFDTWTKNLSSFHKMSLSIAAIFTVLAGIIAPAIKWLDDRSATRQAELVFAMKLIMEEEGLVTEDKFDLLMDSLFIEVSTNAEIDEILHLKTFNEIDTTNIIIDDIKTQTRRLDIKIDTVKERLDRIEGVTTKTYYESLEQAKIDSLRNIILRRDIKDGNQEIIKNKSQERREMINEVKEIIKSDNEKKNKVIKVKRGKPGKKREFRERVLIPL